ncbi:hypothetical protein PS2_034446 [Malus domestica]
MDLEEVHCNFLPSTMSFAAVKNSFLDEHFLQGLKSKLIDGVISKTHECHCQIPTCPATLACKSCFAGQEDEELGLQALEAKLLEVKEAITSLDSKPQIQVRRSLRLCSK